MCGICGKVSFRENHNVNEALLRRMCGKMKHRGPDDEGIYVNTAQGPGPRAQGAGFTVKVGLGHRRLSIIDLSAAGHQPMANEDGAIWIVFNGEIYNFRELRRTLLRKGHRFKSNTDTEVILHLYEDKGIDCVRQLRGMFSFAVWDGKNETLFLARDRLGQKPLFYSMLNNDLVFASELNALLQDDSIGREIDPASIDDFLNYQYVPAPFTIFREINKLQPAHILKWEKGRVSITRYWALDYSKKMMLKEDEYCERVLGLLEESTRIRMISDVPLGAFLSGGIDSSAVAAMMTRLSSMPVKTFSIGFQDDSFDETPYAREAAKFLGTDHQEFIVRPNALEILPELVSHFGEPYADSSAIATYYLSQMTKQKVTVALNGDAGDEAFGGYERYMANKLAQRYRLPLVVAKHILRPALAVLPESTDKKDKINRLKRFLSMASLNSHEAYAGVMSNFQEKERLKMYKRDFSENLRRLLRPNVIVDRFVNSGTQDMTDSMLYADLMTYMPGDLLPKVDITSMSNSLEARSPFLDHKFLEFLAMVPSNLKIRGAGTKYLLKKALKGILPDKIINREKQGFGVPVSGWLRSDLKDYTREILFSEKARKRNYFDIKIVDALVNSHVEGKANNGYKIWALLNLELWHNTFIDR